MPALFGLEAKLSDKNLFSDPINRANDGAHKDAVLVTLQECRNTILRLCKERFAKLKDTELMWVPMFDPRVAKWMGYFPDDEQRQQVRCKQTEALMAFIENEMPRDAEIPRGEMFSPPSAKKSDADLKYYMFGPNPRKQRQISLKATCDAEFDRYLADIKTIDKQAPEFVHHETSPLTWWRINRLKYTNLAKLARKWLGAVATSVPSERAFSTSGNIVTVKRASLSPELVRDLVFIAGNTHKKPSTM